MAWTVLWGKYGDGTNGHHPLVCHLLDTLAVAEHLWTDVLPESTRDWLAADLDLDAVEAGCWIALLTGLHDLGKASPAFQLMTLPDPNGSHRAALAAAGLDLGAQPLPARHDLLTAKTLPDWLVERFGLARPMAWSLGLLLGGHHGVFPQALDVQAAGPASVGGLGWAGARADLAALVANAAGVAGAAPGRSALPSRAAMLIAGLVSVADWIGSNIDYFPYAAPAGVPTDSIDEVDYLARARVKAANALNGLGWLALPTAGPAADFAAMFGFSPRPVQALAASLTDSLTPPAIVVIEAPMGEGKTEAALYAADRWGSGERGFYVALPTQATSDQMFHRVRLALRRRYPGERIALQLLHGHAALSAEFEELRRAGDRLFSPSDLDPDGDAHDGDVMAGTWFTARKRGLLAPYGVGTVDQTLLAALVTRHVFVRLFGLAGKVVVFDEVHAYDTYMSTLLDRLVEWLAAIGTNVVVLSATLPEGRRSALLAAYARGTGRDIHAIPSASHPRISWLAGSVAGAEQVDVSAAARRTLGLSWLRPDQDGTLSDAELFALLGLLEGGGCVAFVCNTVARAQALFGRFRARLPGNASDGGPIVDLLHARFPYEERAEREARLIRRFGPEAGTQRPDRAIIVATQVIEQSLDLDFDAMVTDFAPADLLLQRSGRLHRHPANAQRRPALFAEPTLRIVAPNGTREGEPLVDFGTAAVYDDRHVLLRTWLALRDMEAIEVPDAVGPVIEAVYDERAVPDDLDPAERTAWERTRITHADAMAADAVEAADRWVLRPTVRAQVSDLTRNAAGDDPDAGEFRALTRLDADAETVVCLEVGDEGPQLKGRPVNLADTPSIPEAKRLLGRSLRLADRGVLPSVRAIPVPEGWRRSALLRSARPLLFEPDRSLMLADPGGRSARRLVLDPDLGLVVEPVAAVVRA